MLVRPAPDKATASGELLAVLTKLMLPVEALAAAGAKVTVGEAEAPGANVTGAVKPVILKEEPLMLICEIVTLLPPLLLIIKVCPAVFPTVILPKATVVGVILSWPADGVGDGVGVAGEV